jgi:hypothetical protein
VTVYGLVGSAEAAAGTRTSPAMRGTAMRGIAYENLRRTERIGGSFPAVVTGWLRRYFPMLRGDRLST